MTKTLEQPVQKKKSERGRPKTGITNEKFAYRVPPGTQNLTEAFATIAKGHYGARFSEGTIISIMMAKAISQFAEFPDFTAAERALLLERVDALVKQLRLSVTAAIEEPAEVEQNLEILDKLLNA